MTQEAIELHNLTLGYERHPAVHHLSLKLAAGSLVAVVGPNGAGKSTLIKALAGLVKPMQGHISGLGQQRVAYLPQRDDMDHSFPITVHDMVAMGLWHEVGALGGYSRAQRQRCVDALAQVGLAGFGQRTIATLSGGQFQRALFARLMLQDAPVILLDEPFAGVDTRTSRDLLALLQAWHAEGRTVLAVLHDMDQVRQHFPHAMLLARELVAAGPTGQVLTEANLQRARHLNEAFDDDAPECDVADDDLAPPGLTPGLTNPQGHTHAHAHAHTHGHTHGHSHAHKHDHSPAAEMAAQP
jgi:zinc/manganese transport system ATP-binding protein